jgi:hypothetical protein
MFEDAKNIFGGRFFYVNCCSGGLDHLETAQWLHLSKYCPLFKFLEDLFQTR